MGGGGDDDDDDDAGSFLTRGKEKRDNMTLWSIAGREKSCMERSTRDEV
jgi:hypothetical protein